MTTLEFINTIEENVNNLNNFLASIGKYGVKKINNGYVDWFTGAVLKDEESAIHYSINRILNYLLLSEDDDTLIHFIDECIIQDAYIENGTLHFYYVPAELNNIKMKDNFRGSEDKGEVIKAILLAIYDNTEEPLHNMSKLLKESVTALEKIRQKLFE